MGSGIFSGRKPTLRQITIGALALLIPVGALAMLQLSNITQRAEEHLTTAAIDPVVLLQQKIDSGEVQLSFDEKRGYLSSLLDQLKIPVSSQALVFSKSSFQLHLISPEMPRALYFNDDVYIGWVQGGPVIEITSVDPKSGPVFYTLSQEKSDQPKFEHQTSQCLVCHDSSRSGNPDAPVPRLLMLSVLPDSAGSAIGAFAVLTTDKSPLQERWGGWYVTGKHGEQRHLGNITMRAPAQPVAKINIKDFATPDRVAAGANVTDLSSRFDTAPYLTGQSDLVALMVLGHQTHVHNLIARASFEVRSALGDGQTPNAAPEVTQTQVPESIESLVQDVGEQLVEAMLFAGQAPLTDPVEGTTGFAAEFNKQGPRDSQGRSLRDLDLKQRLLRYPLSYLIYSDSFNEMPKVVKQYVYRRLGEVLSGEDKSPQFSHLSESDDLAISQILKETKPDAVAAMTTREK